jgi:alginate O-acetyltransferase complex protein AlgI
VAGPIVKYQDVEEQLESRSLNAEQVACGLRRFICGLSKKMLIANTVAVMADSVFSLGATELTGAAAWCGAIAYLFQIYFDFSGYSDMAIGLGAMFGFRFNENFDYPYKSLSIKEFWRRWHISVSSWFKEYLYFPLGGNRKGRFRTCVNKIIVFFFTGLWHGANFTFIVWGLWHGFFLLLEEYIPKPGKAIAFKPVKIITSGLRYIYTMLVVIVGFVIFRADTLSYGITFVGKMFADFGKLPESLAPALATADVYTGIIFIAAAVLSFPVSRIIMKKAETKGGAVKIVVEGLSFCGAAVLFLACVLCLASSSYNPFIYFRF